MLPAMKQKMKIKNQIKMYQEKVKMLRDQLKVTGTEETSTKKISDAILTGGKIVKNLVKKGMDAKSKRKKDPNVIKTWTEPPRV